MTSLSRRRVLGTVAVLLGSGCLDADEGNTPTATATERRFAHSVNQPAARTVRHAGGSPAIRSSLVEPTRDWAAEEWLVTAPDERDALEFSTAATGVDAAKEFVADTDLSTQTLLVHQYSIEECLTGQVERIQWGQYADGPPGTLALGLEYTAVERDGHCESDPPKHVEATLLRLPVDGERVGYFHSEFDL